MSGSAPLRLPQDPWPLQVEIELTNVCNAHCSACPRGSMPGYGMLQESTLDRILDLYEAAADARDDLPADLGLPRVTIAGGGEPLIHRRAHTLLERVVARGFATTLITNASRLTPESTEELVRLGLEGICVSFWGIEAEEYEKAMRLPFRETLAKVEYLAQCARAAAVPLIVLWVRSPEIRSGTAAIRRFWSDRGIEVDTDDNAMWNRGGLLPAADRATDGGHRPEVERRVWCTDLYFSDAYNWAGDCVLCCCNYFTQEQIRVGNVDRDSPREIARRKGEILRRRPLPPMCQKCRLPRDLRGRWLAGPILERLSGEERAMLVAYPGADASGGAG